jgi:hypothetical protein
VSYEELDLPKNKWLLITVLGQNPTENVASSIHRLPWHQSMFEITLSIGISVLFLTLILQHSSMLLTFCEYQFWGCFLFFLKLGLLCSPG